MALCKRCRNEAGHGAELCVACREHEREFGVPIEQHPQEPPFDPYQFEINPEGSRSAGRIVETKTGLKGVAFHDDPLVNGKVVVHVGDNKMLCDPKGLKVIGYVD